jgi:hypothetical protein
MELNDKGPGKGSGRRRRRRRRRGGGGSGSGSGAGGGNGNRGQQSNKPVRLDPNDCRQWASGKGPASEGARDEQLTPFTLFCAYHLGITRDEGYSFQSLPQVARRFGMDVAQMKQRIEDFGLETKALEALGFEGKYAQMDIEVAPEGVSRIALAQSMWKDIEPHLPTPPSEPAPVEEEPLDVADDALDEDGQELAGDGLVEQPVADEANPDAQDAESLEPEAVATDEDVMVDLGVDAADADDDEVPVDEQVQL